MYLDIMKIEGWAISHRALDPESLEIHHKITCRQPSLTVHMYVTQSLFIPSSGSGLNLLSCVCSTSCYRNV
ncbi:hypothetical protein M758_UG049200 [Ceratodon purpureus]|nr:hypothetical protein M758_UG049200 [Ceratodon purpureus]